MREDPSLNDGAKCEECGSPFAENASEMTNLCPECAFLLYDKPRCVHSFYDGCCVKCGRDGSRSVYTAKLTQEHE